MKDICQKRAFGKPICKLTEAKGMKSLISDKNSSKYEQNGNTKPPLKEKNSDVEQIVCPVCKKVIPECDLPDKEGVIADNMYFESGIKLVDSDVRIHCKFSHMHDEQENELDESHGLIAVLKTYFDGKGECTHFEIVEIFSQKGGE